MRIPIFITYGKRKVETQALIDCGAKGASYIARSFVNNKNIPQHKLKKKIPVLNVNGTENKDGAIQDYINVRIETRERTASSASNHSIRPRNSYTEIPVANEREP
jgi:hypothetical protein